MNVVLGLGSAVPAPRLSEDGDSWLTHSTCHARFPIVSGRPVLLRYDNLGPLSE
jgi:hypothetical protein